jgi:hypothetical protein
MGVALSRVVYALIRSGVLVFAPPSDGSLAENFMAVGLGGAVGLAAKDVIAKLIDLVKTRLRVADAEIQPLDVKPSEIELPYGGRTTFQIAPRIAVDWSLEPSLPGRSGTIVNGVYAAPDTEPDDAPPTRSVIAVAKAKSDQSRVATATIVLKKARPGGGGGLQG